LELLYDGPYCVLARSCDWFRVQVGDKTDTISTSHLKPCLDRSPNTPWAAQRGHIPLAAPGPPTRAGDIVTTFRALACFGCCEDVITAWVVARNRFFLPNVRGFLYARAPPGCSRPPHRPGDLNNSAGRRSA
jgi:hypothetical protein